MDVSNVGAFMEQSSTVTRGTVSGCLQSAPSHTCLPPPPCIQVN